MVIENYSSGAYCGKLLMVSELTASKPGLEIPDRFKVLVYKAPNSSTVQRHICGHRYEVLEERI